MLQLCCLIISSWLLVLMFVNNYWNLVHFGSVAQRSFKRHYTFWMKKFNYWNEPMELLDNLIKSGSAYTFLSCLLWQYILWYYCSFCLYIFSCFIFVWILFLVYLLTSFYNIYVVPLFPFSSHATFGSLWYAVRVVRFSVRPGQCNNCQWLQWNKKKFCKIDPTLLRTIVYFCENHLSIGSLASFIMRVKLKI